MFACNMKILTQNTNDTLSVAQRGGIIQSINKKENNSVNDKNLERNIGSDLSGTSQKSNKREQKHNSKMKFIHCNSKIQQHITQEQQTPKYPHKNGNKVKNQQYNNMSKNNSSSALSCKKYYQQQQHYQQQQQYHTSMQQTINTTQTTTTNTNNNSNLVKNKNYTNNDILIQQQKHNNANIVNNLVNHNTSNQLETCTCSLQQNRCDKLSLSSFSSPLQIASSEQLAEGDYDCQDQELHSTVCYDNPVKSFVNPSSKTSLSSTEQTTTLLANGCISVWHSNTDLPQQQQSSTISSFKLSNASSNLQVYVSSALAAVEAKKCNSILNLAKSATTTSSTTTTTTAKTNRGQLHLTSNTTSSSSVIKRKSFWKNSNPCVSGTSTVGGKGGWGGVHCSESSSGYSSNSIAQSPKLLKEKQHHVSNKKLISNTSKNKNNNGNVQKYTTTLDANTNTFQQKQISKETVEKIAMTTTSTTSSGSSSTKTSVSSNNSNNVSSFSKTFTTSSKQHQEEGPLEKNVDSNNSNNNSDIKTIASSSTSAPASSVPTSTNSYTLDFLHSVGVKMTNVALRSSGVQESTNAYGNPLVNNTTAAHNGYPNFGMNTNQRPSRYMYGGSNANNGNGGSQHQHQHYNHHHQPSQLTIASFLHKDLLGADNVFSNSGNASSSGEASLSFSNSRNRNYYNDQHQQQQHYTQQPTHTRYHNNHYANPYQQSAVIQHTNYRGGGGYSGEVARLILNAGNNNGQRNSGYAHAHYHSAFRKGEVIKKNEMGQQNSRQLHNNVGSYKNSVNNSQGNKKSLYASSTTSTCSSSSVKSISSNSSHISNRQLQKGALQETDKSTQNLNLAIETLPSKTLGGGNQRVHNHRSYHYNHHGYHHSIMNSPNVLQHQNYYNLTYITTDGSVSGAMSRGCSPASKSLPHTPLSATNYQSPKLLDNSPGHVAMLMNVNGNNFQYHRYPHTQQEQQHQQEFHQFQQQKNFLNKNLLVPLTLNMPSPSPSSTPPTNATNICTNSKQALPLNPSHNILCCSQLDKASTAAAAAAATSSSSSGVIPDNDYDSDTSSNHSSAQIKYHFVKSTKSSFSSSSSSASTTSLTGYQSQQQTCSEPATPATCTPNNLSHNPLDCNYTGVTTKAFPNLQLAQQTQLPQLYGNNSGGTVVSLLNLPTKYPNSYADENCQQQQQQNQFYFHSASSQNSPDHINIAPALQVVNHSNNSSGYWSPSYHNNQFLYHQTTSTQVALLQPTTSPLSSCGSSSASISPHLSTDDIQQQNKQRLQNNYCFTSSSLSPSPCASSMNEHFSNMVIGNNSKADSGMLLAGSSCSSNSSSVSGASNNGSGISINFANEGYTYKRSSSESMGPHQMHLNAQQACQYTSSSTSSLSNSSACTLTTSAVRTQTRNNQFPPLLQTSVTSSVSGSNNSIREFQQLTETPTPTQHLYSHHQQQQSLPPPLPHNLLYNNPQTHHMLALSSSSINSAVHDLFIHTPPDRFLARAHLIEVKEAPVTLLNNSKWDHLSQSIWEKFIRSQQTKETFKRKMHLWRYLYLFIKNAYPRYGLYLVGSTISGFGSDSSDVDMCLVSRSPSTIDPRLEALYNLTVLRDCLCKSGEFENFNLIEAKVPILRFCDRMHKLEVDLNYNNCVGIKNTHLLYCYSQLDWRLRPLVLVTKLWAQYHNINNAKNMTISSYSLVLMVIHFLQYAVNPAVLPCLHDIFPEKFPLLRSNDFGYVDMKETMEPYESKNTQTIGELFLLFLEYYSCFDYTQFAISVRTGGLLPINVCRLAKSIKNDIHQWKELCIEEPFDLTNTARSVYDYETFERVKAVFVASWRILQETLDLNSVFTTIIIPSSCTSESTSVQPNINPTNYATLFAEAQTADSDVVTDTKKHFEHHINDFSITTANENYKDSHKSYNEESVLNVDGYVTDNFDGNTTVTNILIVDASAKSKLPKRKDLNRTITPRQNKEFGEKNVLSSPSSSVVLNRNNNNKIAAPLIS